MAKSGDMKESAQASVNEKRTVKLTNKGLEWQIDVNSKKFNSLVGVLRTLIQKTEPLLSSSKDIEALKAHINALEINLKALSETCDRLRGLLIFAEQEDEVQQVNQTYESIAKKMATCYPKVISACVKLITRSLRRRQIILKLPAPRGVANPLIPRDGPRLLPRQPGCVRN